MKHTLKVIAVVNLMLIFQTAYSVLSIVLLQLGWLEHMPSKITLTLVALITITMIASKMFQTSSIWRSYEIIHMKGMLAMLVLLIFIQSPVQNAYYDLTQTPRILKIDKNVVIQGDSIHVQGVGFGGEWEKGVVRIDDLPLIVRQWSDDIIVVEIPVPAGYFTGKLYVVRGDKMSNFVTVMVADPSQILR